jgi:NAD(P)-dependent dehydrogenase (short-subunit alcohol dehydrogenase family)
MSKSQRRTISGRTVVITGAASGIGRALAQRLSAHSCPVAIADIDEKGLKETEASLHGPALLRVLDVADAEAQRDFAGEVVGWAPPADRRRVQQRRRGHFLQRARHHP